MTLVELLAASMIGHGRASSAPSRCSTPRRTAAARRRPASRPSRRGRAALEDITRQVRSQVCVGTTPPVIEATATRLVFTRQPDHRAHGLGGPPCRSARSSTCRRRAGASSGTITENVVTGTGSPPTFTRRRDDAHDHQRRLAGEQQGLPLPHASTRRTCRTRGSSRRCRWSRPTAGSSRTSRSSSTRCRSSRGGPRASRPSSTRRST